MSSHRQAQVRLERKRRRRAERRKRLRLAQSHRTNASAGSLDDEWSSTLFLSPNGRPPDPERVAQFKALGTMSDALTRLMEPVVDPPRYPSEIPDYESWLELGAAVWNATAEATTGQALREALQGIVDDWDLSEVGDPIGLVERIALRKLRLFGHDPRRVESVRVRANRGQATVQAMSTALLR